MILAFFVFLPIFVGFDFLVIPVFDVLLDGTFSKTAEESCRTDEGGIKSGISGGKSARFSKSGISSSSDGQNSSGVDTVFGDTLKVISPYFPLENPLPLGFLVPFWKLAALFDKISDKG